MSQNTPISSAPIRRFSPPNIGDTITFHGRDYLIGEPIGKGYFGSVYACTDAWGNRLVAKVLHPQNRSFETVQNDWQRELRNLRELRHPFITFVHEAFVCNDTFYLIMERCDESLTDLISWPEIQPDIWVKPLGCCLLQAINFIHVAGYVHKDIHPGNVFVTRVQNMMGSSERDAMVFKVGDLGLTKLEPEIDVFNTMLAQWMLPPEAINSTEFGRIGKAIDIYHAGLLLLSLLLKRVPSFTRDEVTAGVPRQMAESLNSPFSPAIARALRRHVEHRTPTALDFYRDLMECEKIRTTKLQQSQPSLL